VCACACVCVTVCYCVCVPTCLFVRLCVRCVHAFCVFAGVSGSVAYVCAHARVCSCYLIWCGFFPPVLVGVCGEAGMGVNVAMCVRVHVHNCANGTRYCHPRRLVVTPSYKLLLLAADERVIGVPPRSRGSLCSSANGWTWTSRRTRYKVAHGPFGVRYLCNPHCTSMRLCGPEFHAAYYAWVASCSATLQCFTI